MDNKHSDEQLAKSMGIDEIPEEEESLRAVWDVLDTSIYHIVDDEGVNVAGALLRRLSEDTFVYVDDSQGYELVDKADLLWAILIPQEVHTPLGWGKQGEVIEL